MSAPARVDARDLRAAGTLRRPELGKRPAGNTRSFERPETPTKRTPVHRSNDHRYARPAAHRVRQHPATRRSAPRHRHYRPYYSRWYCHPYYRYRHSTVVVVHFGFRTHAWTDNWTPARRTGWRWVPGYWDYGYWHPGHWTPTSRPRAHYIYVPGWWDREVYVDGYYRSEKRTDGDWEWTEGYYLEDGTYVRGHWRPGDAGPEGYSWEPGFWDGEMWSDGFWRPEFRSGYTWVSAYFDEDGIFHSGYWMPLEDMPDYVWIPGWFDGNEWVDGYWVAEAEYFEEDLSTWQPEQGWDDWEIGGGWGHGEVLDNQSETQVESEHRPLGMPVQWEEL